MAGELLNPLKDRTPPVLIELVRQGMVTVDVVQPGLPDRRIVKEGELGQSLKTSIPAELLNKLVLLEGIGATNLPDIALIDAVCGVSGEFPIPEEEAERGFFWSEGLEDGVSDNLSLSAGRASAQIDNAGAQGARGAVETKDSRSPKGDFQPGRTTQGVEATKELLLDPKANSTSTGCSMREERDGVTGEAQHLGSSLNSISMCLLQPYKIMGGQLHASIASWRCVGANFVRRGLARSKCNL